MYFKIEPSTDIKVDNDPWDTDYPTLTGEIDDSATDSDNSSARFSKPVTDEQLDSLLNSTLPKRTSYANTFACNVWREWAACRLKGMGTVKDYVAPPHVLHLNLFENNNDSLSYWLPRFIVEIRRQDGSPYPGNTLYNITCGIQRLLRTTGDRNVNFFSKDNKLFSEFRKVLDSKMKKLTEEGVGIATKRADPVSEEDENILWNSQTFSLSTAQSISYAVFFYNCKYFGVRGMDQHRALAVTSYNIRQRGETGGKILYFLGYDSKKSKGGANQRKADPGAREIVGETTNPRCIVQLFEKYLSMIPETGAFYRRPLAKLAPGGFPRFSDQAMGERTMSRYIKSMFSQAGIDTRGRTITNHSGIVSFCTNLDNKGFTAKEIESPGKRKSDAIELSQRELGGRKRAISQVSQTPEPKPSSSSRLPPLSPPVFNASLYPYTPLADYRPYLPPPRRLENCPSKNDVEHETHQRKVPRTQQVQEPESTAQPASSPLLTTRNHTDKIPESKTDTDKETNTSSEGAMSLTFPSIKRIHVDTEDGQTITIEVPSLFKTVILKASK